MQPWVYPFAVMTQFNHAICKALRFDGIATTLHPTMYSFWHFLCLLSGYLHIGLKFYPLNLRNFRLKRGIFMEAPAHLNSLFPLGCISTKATTYRYLPVLSPRCFPSPLSPHFLESPFFILCAGRGTKPPPVLHFFLMLEVLLGLNAPYRHQHDDDNKD